MDFLRHGSGVRWWWKKQVPSATSVASEGTECHRHTVGRVIPWRVARLQSPPPFHPAGKCSLAIGGSKEEGDQQRPEREGGR